MTRKAIVERELKRMRTVEKYAEKEHLSKLFFEMSMHLMKRKMKQE